MLLFILPALALMNETHKLFDIHDHVSKFLQPLGALWVINLSY